MHPPDRQRLEAFQQNADEKAFEGLVKEYLPLVIAVALRMGADRASADDIGQAVFSKLARKPAARLKEIPLSVWLHGEARSAARSLIRSEKRRVRREQLALELRHNMETSWEKLSPLIDQAIGKLPPADRQVIIGRYFEQNSHQEISRTLGLTPEAARMRINRALEKLRSVLARRGITTSASALEFAFLANPGLCAPLQSTQVASVASIACSSAGSGISTNLGLHFLIMTTTQKATTAALCALIAIFSTVYLTRKDPDQVAGESSPALAGDSPTRDLRTPRNPDRMKASSHVAAGGPGEGMNMNKIDARNREMARDSARVQLTTDIQKLADELRLNQAEVDQLRSVANDRLDLFDGDVPVGSYGFRGKTLEQMKEIIEKEKSVTLDSVARVTLEGDRLKQYDDYRSRMLEKAARSEALRQLQAAGIGSDLTGDERERMVSAFSQEAQSDLARGGDGGVRSLILSASEKMAAGKSSGATASADQEMSARLIDEEAGVAIDRRMELLSPVLDEVSRERYHEALRNFYDH